MLKFIAYIFVSVVIITVCGLVFIHIPLVGFLPELVISPMLIVAGIIFNADFISDGVHVGISAAGLELKSQLAWVVHSSSFAIVGLVIGFIGYITSKTNTRQINIESTKE